MPIFGAGFMDIKNIGKTANFTAPVRLYLFVYDLRRRKNYCRAAH